MMPDSQTIITEESRVLHGLIHPPQDCRSITKVAPLAAEILDVMRSMPLPLLGLGDLAGRLDSMIELCKVIERAGTDMPAEWHEKTGFPRGSFITEYPVYAALEHVSKRANYSVARVVLSAHVVLAVYLGQPKPPASGDFRPIPDHNVLAACREIRLLPEKFLALFGDVPYDRDCFYTGLEAFIRSCPPGVPQTILTRFRNIRRVIGLAKGVEHPEKRNRQANGPRSFIDVSWRSDESGIDRDDGLRSEGALSLSAFAGSDEATLHEAVNEGLPASDVISVHTIRCSDTRYPVGRGLNSVHGLYRQRAVSNQIKRQAQLLSGRWEQLGELDIVVFLQWVERSSDPSALALLISFVTGRSLDVVTSTRLYSRDAQIPMSHSGAHISISLESKTWISGPPMPDRKRPIRASWHQNLVATTENLVLPIPDLLWDALLQKLGHTPRNWTGNLFTKSQRTSVTLNAKQALLDATKRSDIGLTVTRLQRHLFNVLTNGRGDVADATLITGILPPFGQSSATYYYNADCSHLESVYLDAMARIPGLQSLAGESMRQSSLREEAIGSPFCPRPDRLPDLVSDLKGNLQRHRFTPPSRQSLADFHNSYVIYTLFFLAFATGYRSVKFPVSRETDIDWETGFLVIADKIGDDMSHSRLVPLAPTVINHLRQYQRHREALIRRLWGLYKQQAPSHFLFFLNRRNNSIAPVTPTTIRAHAQWAFDLPLNSNRHFLRSELRSRGVPGELVDVFMGHWSNGQEPHGHFSSFSYRDYRRQVVPVMENILAEMGWEPVEGIGGEV